MIDSPDQLWTCPECGARLVSRNLWHACGNATLEQWHQDMGPRAQALFDRLEALVAVCGPYHIAPAKTPISFMGLVRFANITSLSERGMTFTFALPHRLDSARIAGVREVGRGWIVHRLRVVEPEELDDEIQEWLRTSYRLMGMRERLLE